MLSEDPDLWTKLSHNMRTRQEAATKQPRQTEPAGDSETSGGSSGDMTSPGAEDVD